MYLSEKAGGEGGKGKGAINNRESVLGRPERKLRVEEVVRIQLPLDLAERVVIFRLVVVLRPDLWTCESYRPFLPFPFPLDLVCCD